jgi:hypothetical protein
MQDVACSEVDRLKVSSEQLEIMGAELLKELVLRPAGHTCSLTCRESAPGEPYVSVQEPTVPKCT